MSNSCSLLTYLIFFCRSNFEPTNKEGALSSREIDLGQLVDPGKENLGGVWKESEEWETGTSGGRESISQESGAKAPSPNLEPSRET